MLAHLLLSTFIASSFHRSAPAIAVPIIIDVRGLEACGGAVEASHGSIPLVALGRAGEDCPRAVAWACD